MIVLIAKARNVCVVSPRLPLPRSCISINNPFEENILTTNKTLEWFDNVWPEEGVITSGISFKAGDWVWFGAGLGFGMGYQRFPL